MDYLKTAYKMGKEAASREENIDYILSNTGPSLPGYLTSLGLAGGAIGTGTKPIAGAIEHLLSKEKFPGWRKLPGALGRKMGAGALLGTGMGVGMGGLLYPTGQWLKGNRLGNLGDEQLQALRAEVEGNVNK